MVPNGHCDATGGSSGLSAVAWCTRGLKNRIDQAPLATKWVAATFAFESLLVHALRVDALKEYPEPCYNITQKDPAAPLKQEGLPAVDHREILAGHALGADA